MKMYLKTINTAPLNVKVLLYWEEDNHFESGKRIIEDDVEFHSLSDGEMRVNNPTHWAEHPEAVMGKEIIKKENIYTMLSELDEKYKAWELSGMNELELSHIIKSASDTYLLVNNNFNQEELNEINDKYDCVYPLFKTINDAIDGKLN